jgi:hypothetical protein
MLPKAASEFPVTCFIIILLSLYNNTGGASKRMGNLYSAFEKAGSQSSAFEK